MFGQTVNIFFVSAKTTGKQCFVSYNIPDSQNNILMAQVEARISKERKLHLEKF